MEVSERSVRARDGIHVSDSVENAPGPVFEIARRKDAGSAGQAIPRISGATDIDRGLREAVGRERRVECDVDSDLERAEAVAVEQVAVVRS
ncbi:hypothetical protein C496_23406 [Natronorubrum tibetense GA33]|uniref:Uncharacterized protein n=1 Tax=Natronorubrum tibetense GA33 TaxID=1114856 RepID=L9VEW4_9EURY|nr:hypothetical protein C496_23406 [Natronorubrum tibetense GA33]